MKKYLEILKKCSLFYGIDEENILKMLSCLGAKVSSYNKKETIFSEGEVAKCIGIVLSGSVQITEIDYYGNRAILSEIKESELFLEAFACAGIESIPVYIVANESCEILLIESERILRTCDNGCDFHKAIIYNLMKNLAKKTTMLHQKIDIISKPTTKEKLMTYLYYESKKAGGDIFDIPFNREELADYLGVERSGLSLEISKLKKQGIIKNTKNHFELIKRS